MCFYSYYRCVLFLFFVFYPLIQKDFDAPVYNIFINNQYQGFTMKAQTKIKSYNEELFPNDDLPNYQIKKVIGKGSYGHVAKAKKLNCPGYVAIKKITGLFNSLPETRRFFRQIVLLKNCKHPNIVQLLDVILPKSQTPQNFQSLYLVTEYCDSDLAKVFRIDGNFLQIQHIRHISYQIMCGIKYLHSANIIHRDLKPANVLINTKGLTVKICDFGLSRIVGDETKQKQFEESQSQSQQQQTKVEPAKPSHTESPSKRGRGGLKRMGTGTVDIQKQKQQQKNQMRLKKQEKMTNPNVKLTLRVTTRWYRAPQIILLDKDYNKPIDIWSVGCIFGQLLKMQKSVCADSLQRFPLFPGKYCYPVSPNTLGVIYKNGYPQSRNDQLFMILSAIGKPTQQQLSFLSDSQAIDYVRKIQLGTRKTFDDMFPKVDKDAIHLLKQTLKFNPKDRLTIDQILNLQFYKPIRNPKLEQGRTPIQMNSQIQDEHLTIQQLRKALVKQITIFFNK